MYCVNSIALLLMIVCYTDALNDGNNPTPLAPTLTRPDPTIQQVVICEA